MGLYVDKGIERAEKEARAERTREDAETIAAVIVPSLATAVAKQVREAVKPGPWWQDRGVIAGVVAAFLSTIGAAVVAWWFRPA